MKQCSYCQKDVDGDAVKCKYCGGWFSDDADIKQKEIDKEKQVEALLKDKKDKAADDIGMGTEYFSVSTKKLVVMCILTFGIYDLYWFYKNWKAVKVQEQKKLSPFWRTIFSIIFCYSLFKRVNVSAEKKGFKPRMSHGALTALYIFATMLGRLPDPFWFLSFASLISLVYATDAIRHINHHVNSGAQENNKLTGIEIFFLIFGILGWVGTVSAFLFPEYY